MCFLKLAPVSATIMNDLSTIILIFLSLGIGSVLLVWFYYEHRARHAHLAQRQRSVFHCIKCGHLYEAAANSGQTSCPACGFQNQRLTF